MTRRERRVRACRRAAPVSAGSTWISGVDRHDGRARGRVGPGGRCATWHGHGALVCRHWQEGGALTVSWRSSLGRHVAEAGRWRRARRSVGWPTLAVMRRTWRFLPSWMMISSQLSALAHADGGRARRQRLGGSMRAPGRAGWRIRPNPAGAAGQARRRRECPLPRGP